jgi:hypothetical protein
LWTVDGDRAADGLGAGGSVRWIADICELLDRIGSEPSYRDALNAQIRETGRCRANAFGPGADGNAR